jgi:hypothetical protein
MFARCTSLTSAPELPATNLVDGCYIGMFDNCTSLSSVNVGFTNWHTYAVNAGSIQISTSNWLNNVSPTGIFECPSALTEKRGSNTIPEGWTVKQY